jgi:integrase
MAARRGHGEGSIYQRGDGRWAASVELGWQLDARRRLVRRRKTIYGETRHEVSQKLQRDIAAGKPIESSKQTVAQLLNAWLETKRPPARATSTYEFYISRLHHLLPALGTVYGKRTTTAARPALSTLVLGSRPLSPLCAFFHRRITHGTGTSSTVGIS